MSRRWGKAGVRLTERESAQRNMTAGRKRLEREQQQEAAYKLWSEGKAVPYRITLNLDRCGLEGPEVDAACNAREPEVDQWEEGILYPRWDQLVALAELTGVDPGWLCRPVKPEHIIPLHKTSAWWHLREAERQQYLQDYKEPVLSFRPEVVDARMRGEPSPLAPPGQLDLF